MLKVRRVPTLLTTKHISSASASELRVGGAIPAARLYFVFRTTRTWPIIREIPLHATHTFSIQPFHCRSQFPPKAGLRAITFLARSRFCLSSQWRPFRRLSPVLLDLSHTGQRHRMRL